MSWCDPVRNVESRLIDAVLVAEGRVPNELRPFLTTSSAKQLLSTLIRGALRTCGIPLVPLDSGNADVEYLVWRGVAVLRVKGLNREGKPSNYETDTALAYHLGDDVDSLPDLPPLPRVDVSYRIEEDTFTIRCVELLEWVEGTAVRRYQLPLKGTPREIEVAGELDFQPKPATVRPRREAAARRRKKDRKTGDAG